MLTRICCTLVHVYFTVASRETKLAAASVVVHLRNAAVHHRFVGPAGVEAGADVNDTLAAISFKASCAGATGTPVSMLARSPVEARGAGAAVNRLAARVACPFCWTVAEVCIDPVLAGPVVEARAAATLVDVVLASNAAEACWTRTGKAIASLGAGSAVEAGCKQTSIWNALVRKQRAVDGEQWRVAIALNGPPGR